MACIFLWSSAVRIHDLQAYRKMDVTRECISCIAELRENPVSAAVVCAVLESISGLEPSTVITEPRYLKFVTVSSFCLFTLISGLMPLVLSSVWSSWHGSPHRRLWRLCQDAQLILPVLLLLLQSHWCHQQSGDWLWCCPQCSQCLHDLIRHLSWSFPKNVLKRVDESRHPCLIQLVYRYSYGHIRHYS